MKYAHTSKTTRLMFNERGIRKQIALEQRIRRKAARMGAGVHHSRKGGWFLLSEPGRADLDIAGPMFDTELESLLNRLIEADAANKNPALAGTSRGAEILSGSTIKENAQ